MKLRVVEIGVGEYAAQVEKPTRWVAGPNGVEGIMPAWFFIKDPNGVVLISDEAELALLEGFKAVQQRVVIEEVDMQTLEAMYEQDSFPFKHMVEEDGSE